MWWETVGDKMKRRLCGGLEQEREDVGKHGDAGRREFTAKCATWGGQHMSTQEPGEAALPRVCPGLTEALLLSCRFSSGWDVGSLGWGSAHAPLVGSRPSAGRHQLRPGAEPRSPPCAETSLGLPSPNSPQEHL